MTWIKVHDTIRDNRKILIAADHLRIHEATMVGHMVFLWLWAIENAPGGRLDVSDEMIGRVSGFGKSSRSFIQALLEARLLVQREDGGYDIVNYGEHIAPILIAAGKNKERQATFRSRQLDGARARRRTPGHPQVDPAANGVDEP